MEKVVCDRYRGRDVGLYILRGDGFAVGVTDFGASVRFIRICTPRGEKDVTLGYNRTTALVASGAYCGATIGRVANRIGGAAFCLGGVRYALDCNEGKCCNHGGFSGFDKHFFAAAEERGGVTMSLVSPDGEGGFPGTLRLQVKFRVEGKVLTVVYEAESDADTLFSPTCHIYFNLGGEESGSALDTALRINASHYAPIDGAHLPTGELRRAAGTPFDFRSFKRIGRDIGADDGQIRLCGGYDHNFALCGEHAATAFCDATGIKLDLYTDLPGLQLYTANGLSGQGKTRRYAPHDAFCLEPQYFPNAVNTAGFRPPILRSGRKATHYIRYEFGV